MRARGQGACGIASVVMGCRRARLQQRPLARCETSAPWPLGEGVRPRHHPRRGRGPRGKNLFREPRTTSPSRQLLFRRCQTERQNSFRDGAARRPPRRRGNRLRPSRRRRISQALLRLRRRWKGGVRKGWRAPPINEGCSRRTGRGCDVGRAMLSTEVRLASGVRSPEEQALRQQLYDGFVHVLECARAFCCGDPT